ncbi:Methyltransferase domain-containing protein [Chitinophaga jiangningensis]|uniref:Methyltransferase domain-containing protein n=1 Tax=Chitinophaga jiangningensis TaxID=1419482 RepID=A0A1M7MV32_9BACT|nr:methyltransferase domain-containing protein [Chitinophaga jiangningensis]SHM95017.1 Methyltransferase domain-containing protein [Chitinophaga jiangningensis]
MEIKEAIALIHAEGLQAGTWADLGCGEGLFSVALAHLLPPGSTILAIDQQPVKPLPYSIPAGISVMRQQADFSLTNFQLPALQGIVMANSLHYITDKPNLIKRLAQSLTDDGTFIIVEYETTQANPWVPYPITLQALTELFREAGFTNTIKLGERNSVYRSGKMYAARISR